MPITTDKLFYDLKDVLMNLKKKVNELKAFNLIWDETFESIKKITGQESTITIANYLLLETYSTDKFHIIISDLQSSLASLMLDSETFIKNINKEFSLERINELHNEKLSRYQNEAIEKIKKRFKNQGVSSPLEYIQYLNNEVKGTRHTFNHKYEKMIVNKYEQSKILKDIQAVDVILTEYMKFINEIALIQFNMSFEIQDEIMLHDYLYDIRDMILFGSIKSSFVNFIQDLELALSKKQEFLKLRKEYYEKRIVDLVDNSV